MGSTIKGDPVFMHMVNIHVIMIMPPLHVQALIADWLFQSNNHDNVT